MVLFMSENEYAMIPVLPKTKERADKLARKEETYDDFVNRLLDVLEAKKR